MKQSTLLSACVRAGFCLVLLLSAHASHGQTVKTIDLNYSENDFDYMFDEEGYLTIGSSKLETRYDLDLDAPALPIFYVSVLVAKNQKAMGVKVMGAERLIYGDVTMSATPEFLPTNESERKYTPRRIGYTKGIFPNEQASYLGMSIIDGYTIASFKICPYKYDVEEKALSFIDDMSLQIELTTIEQKVIANDSDNVVIEKDGSYVKTLVANAEEMDSLYPESSRDNGCLRAVSPTNKIDYLIITSNALASEFQILADWKMRKGVRTHVATVENIMTMYTNQSWRSQRKIKQFIYDYYLAHQTDYVLLAGDHDIVPTQGCYSKVTSKTKSGEDTVYVDIIPADVYYASFQGNFDWDANNNGIKGEVEDGLVNAIDICLTRAPVSTVYQASSFVEKVINYERNPPVDTWKEKLFSVADVLDTVIIYNGASLSDAMYYSNIIYQYGIQPYWTGTRNCWDGFISDIGQFPYWILPDKIFCDELEKGYSFLDVNCHGDYKIWNLPNYFFHRDSVPNINNYRPLVVVTTACNTSGFDNIDDPCLGEAFIRSANSGVVAYLGSSRYGWYARYKPNYHPVGASGLFNRDFYKKLFSNPKNNKNYGKIVKEAKTNNIATFYGEYTPERWLRLSLNPFGDAEMPIYTKTPKRFTNVIVDNVFGSYITIDTGVDSCRICLMDLNGGSDLYRVDDNVRTATLSGSPIDFSLCISKQGYVTYSSKVRRSSNGNYYVQNEEITDNQYIAADNVYMGKNVTNQKPSGNVVVKNGRLEVNADETIMQEGFEVKRGAELIIR